MKHGTATIEEIGAFDEIIDVRTPDEFAEDRIPGSINCPVLSNTERIEVGTLYKQASPFEARKIGAAYVSDNIARHLRETFFDRPKNWRPLVLCWRGGQRSGAMTYVLRRIGWDAHQLEGGYKSYRKQVVDRLAELPGRFQFRVICGATGSGKSRVLQALEQLGEQVLDLEKLACHKGSVLGVLPDAPQPSQKMFESLAGLAFQGFDPGRPVYVEAESRRIGLIHLPNELLERIRSSPCYAIEASLEARIDFLLRDYDYFTQSPDLLNVRLDELYKLLGHEIVERWKAYANTNQWKELVGELLERHYDPLYRRSQNGSFTGLSTARKFSSDNLSPEGIEVLARRIREQRE